MACTVLVQVVLVALMRVSGPVDTVAAARDDALQVTWIEPPPAEVPPVADPPREPSPARAASPRRSPLPREAETRVMETRSSDRETPSSLAAVDDVWPESPGRSPRTSGIDPSAFRRDPLSRRDTTFEPAPARMEAAIRDRSFGGWMQRTTKARICGDLAAQLRKAPESADAVIASMRRHGCKA